MSSSRQSVSILWTRIGPRWLPFADAASQELPLGRLLRLGLFQFCVGMVLVLTNGTLNRVMIVELSIPASLVALMISLPLVFAPFRALIGHRSDYHRSALGWRRVPYIWIGTMLQFGGLAIVPFCLLVLTGDGHGPAWAGEVGAALAFLLIGAGIHTTQTAGLALATEIAPDESRPRVVALLYVMLLIGTVSTAWVFGYFLSDFTPTRLIQVVQSAAVATLILNSIALWKQEARNPVRTAANRCMPPFREVWRSFVKQRDASRLLLTVGLGSAAFSMQDILLEPYGGQVLGMSVSQTTALTGLLSIGTLLALGLAAHVLDRKLLPARLAVVGALLGIAGFTLIVFGGSLQLIWLFQTGTFLIGFAVGLFSVGMLIEAMRLADASGSGIALGAWVQFHASAAGLAIACGGFLRDLVTGLLDSGHLGTGLNGEHVGYAFVYHVEIALLFACLIAMAPLVRYSREQPQSNGLEMAEFPN